MLNCCLMKLVSELLQYSKDVLKILVLLRALYIIVDCNNVVQFIFSCLS